jgi:hypothetical protein
MQANAADVLTGMNTTFLVALCICMASPSLAQEVLYCTDTASTGFGWTDSGAQSYPFIKSRYTVKVVSDIERVIARMPDNNAVQYKCERSSARPDLIQCQSLQITEDLQNTWLFYHNSYTSAFLFGITVGSVARHIYVTYGTCTKF